MDPTFDVHYQDEAIIIVRSFGDFQLFSSFIWCGKLPGQGHILKCISAFKLPNIFLPSVLEVLFELAAPKNTHVRPKKSIKV